MSAPFATAERIPASVPKEVLREVDFDKFTSEGDDPWLSVSRLHEGPPVIWMTEANFGRPGWVLTRNDVISEAFIDWEHFSSERPGMVADMLGEPVRLNPIEIDPPRHHQFRRILNPYFTPKSVKDFDDPVRQICRELIAKFRDRGECEFVDEFAVPFPSYVFLDLMGMPRDRLDDFIGWQNDLMRAPDPMQRVAAARSIYAYLKAHMTAQQENPTNDFLRAMVSAEVEGRPIDYYELMGMFYVLYVGGLDTVYSTIGWILHHVATHPELQERLRADLSLLPQAVEEFCRAFSVVVTHRSVAKDFVFHGVPMKKGDEVNLPIMLANRDPAAFDNPHVVDIDRKPRHITFGTGTHNCVGLHLAKREMRIVLEEFLTTFDKIRIKPAKRRAITPAAPSGSTTFLSPGLKHMPETNEQLMQRFLGYWSTRDAEGMVNCFAPDGVYDNVPERRPMNGREAIRSWLDMCFKHLSRIDAKVLTLAVNGEWILSERLDDHIVGDRHMPLPVMNVSRIVDGRIVLFRDYYDRQTVSDLGIA